VTNEGRKSRGKSSRRLHPSMVIRNSVAAHIRDAFKLEGRARAIPSIKLTADVMNKCKDMSLQQIKQYIGDHKPELQKKLDGYIKQYA
jgi:hypothetical protein